MKKFLLLPSLILLSLVNSCIIPPSNSTSNSSSDNSTLSSSEYITNSDSSQSSTSTEVEPLFLMEDIQRRFFYFYEQDQLKSYYQNYVVISDTDFTDVEISHVNFISGTTYQDEFVRKEPIKYTFQDKSYDGYAYVILLTADYNAKNDSYNQITFSFDSEEVHFSLDNSVNILHHETSLQKDLYFIASPENSALNYLGVAIYTVNNGERYQIDQFSIYSNNWLPSDMVDSFRHYLRNDTEIFETHGAIGLGTSTTSLSKTFAFFIRFNIDGLEYYGGYYLNNADFMISYISHEIDVDSFLKEYKKSY